MVVILRKTLRIETAEIIRPTSGVEFIQGLVLADRNVQAFVFWYCEPTVSTVHFVEKLSILLRDYEVQMIAGDYNACHPDWCTKHDAKKEDTSYAR